MRTAKESVASLLHQPGERMYAANTRCIIYHCLSYEANIGREVGYTLDRSPIHHRTHYCERLFNHSTTEFYRTSFLFNIGHFPCISKCSFSKVGFYFFIMAFSQQHYYFMLVVNYSPLSFQAITWPQQVQYMTQHRLLQKHLFT